MSASSKIRALCVGHPSAKIAWPHRELHEIADEVEKLESRWQPIGTAPKDGSNILAWCDSWHGFHIVHWDIAENAWVEGSWVFETGPTDWMPIDPPGTKPDGVREANATAAMDVVQRLVGVPAFMMTTFGERPIVSIKFDDRKGVWAFLNALADARKLVNKIT
jgi:hypothetical protein